MRTIGSFDEYVDRVDEGLLGQFSGRLGQMGLHPGVGDKVATTDKFKFAAKMPNLWTVKEVSSGEAGIANDADSQGRIVWVAFANLRYPKSNEGLVQEGLGWKLNEMPPKSGRPFKELQLLADYLQGKTVLLRGARAFGRFDTPSNTYSHISVVGSARVTGSEESDGHGLTLRLAPLKDARARMVTYGGNAADADLAMPPEFTVTVFDDGWGAWESETIMLAK